jgi:hypothetical protein
LLIMGYFTQIFKSFLKIYTFQTLPAEIYRLNKTPLPNAPPPKCVIDY